MAAPARRTSSRRNLIAVGMVAVAAIVAAVWWQVAPSTKPAKVPTTAQREGRTPGAMRLIDGKWQRIDPRDPRIGGGFVIPRTADGMVRVEGKVYELGSAKTSSVSGVEVVFSGSAGEATTMSDADGHYHVDLEPGSYRAFVRGDGVLSIGPRVDDRLPTAPQPGVAGLPDDQLASALVLVEDQRGIDLPVVRGGTITGKVVDRSGRPIRGAVVRAMGAPVRPVLGTDLAETTADGTFHLDVPAGNYRLQASHSSFAGVPDDDATFVQVEVGDNVQRDLTLVAGCVIEGRVMVAGGAASSDGAIEKQWGASDEEFAPAGTIAADGTFRWTTTETTDVVLRAWPWKSPPTTSRKFACQEGARYRDVVFTVPDRAPDMAGVVVTADGKPARFAFLDITALSPGGINQQERADADGRWGIFAMPPGDYRIQVFVADGGVVNETVTSPRTDIRLVLGGVGSITGTIAGIDNGSFTLELAGCDDGAGRLDRVRRQLVVPVHAGRYRIDGVPACGQSVIARSPDRERSESVTVEAGGVARLDLDLGARKKKLVTGVVTGPDGARVQDATVTAAYGDDSARTTTDANGWFSIETYAGEGIYAYKRDMQAFAMVGEADVPEERVDLQLAGDVRTFDDVIEGDSP
jgi:hypothetical protein